MWEKISAVFQFHRDKKNLALYSQLHEWSLNYVDESDTEKETGKDQPDTNEANDTEIQPNTIGVNAIEMTIINETTPVNA